MNKKYKYDYLLVGAGLFNAIFAKEAIKDGKDCLVVEKRNHIGGNLYCERIDDVIVHAYGAHVFHTSKKEIWNYVNQLCEFNHYLNSPLAKYKDKLYNLPFNMNTFYQLWGVITPEEAQQKIEKQRAKIENPRNCEEQALSLVGEEIYETLIKGYTEKQWGDIAANLPAFIIKRIPLRFTFNNNYFNDPWQGIPVGGYNHLIEQCFSGCDIILNQDFFKDRNIVQKARKIIFSGMIDQYYDYCFGHLAYRSLRFEHETLSAVSNYQGNAVINYTERKIPYTRIIEHKHFEFGIQSKTVITREYPQVWHPGLESYYPINTEENQKLYNQYKKLSQKESNIYFGGRLGSYKYYNMDETIEAALRLYIEVSEEK